MKIKCKSIPERFRRAGMVFSNSPAEYDVDERTLKVLRAEPMLVVEVLPEKKEPEKEKAPDKEKTSASQDQAGKKDKDKK